METLRAFSAVLRAARKERGLTQEKLAEKSDLDPTFISMMERGLRQPTIRTLFSLAGALDLKASEIVRNVEIAKDCKD